MPNYKQHGVVIGPRDDATRYEYPDGTLTLHWDTEAGEIRMLRPILTSLRGLQINGKRPNRATVKVLRHGNAVYDAKVHDWLQTEVLPALNNE